MASESTHFLSEGRPEKGSARAPLYVTGASYWIHGARKCTVAVDRLTQSHPNGLYPLDVFGQPLYAGTNATPPPWDGDIVALSTSSKPTVIALDRITLSNPVAWDIPGLPHPLRRLNHPVISTSRIYISCTWVKPADGPVWLEYMVMHSYSILYALYRSLVISADIFTYWTPLGGLSKCVCWDLCPCAWPADLEVRPLFASDNHVPTHPSPGTATQYLAPYS